MTTDERLEKVEGHLAHVRWFNRCLIACIVLALGGWFLWKSFGPDTAWAQSGTKEIRANAFILEDENSKTRATLSVSEDEPQLKLIDENGKSRAGLGYFKDIGPGLMLMDENGKTLATLMIGKDGPGLRLMDQNGNTRVVLWLSLLTNQPSLVLKDENGKSRAALSVPKAGPRLELRDENGKPIWLAP